MNFTSAEKVLQTIRQGDAVEFNRATNRTKINDMANCYPLMPEEEAKKAGLKINVTWGELMVLLAQGRRQYRNAFRADEHLFRVKLPLAPPEHQGEWELAITEKINQYPRESPEYFEFQESRWAALVSHGIAPAVWYHDDDWMPEFVAISDLRVPTDTLLSFKNLDWWAVKQRYTPLSLLDEVCDLDPHRRWDRPGVKKILQNYKETNVTDAVNNYDVETDIEKFHNLLKQNGGMTDADAVPTINLWHFYFKDTDGVFMRIVPDTAVVKGSSTDFLWQSDQPIAQKREHLLHCQFGDLNNDPPFTYQAVRSLGFVLLEPCFYGSLARNKLLQHMFDQFNIWLKTNDPADRARASVQQFSNLAVLKPGISVVPANERHQVNAELVEMGMAQMKQLEQEASSSYTQQTDTGTRKEQTAFETSVKVQQVNAMTNGLLLKAFIYEAQLYREICRRFCKPDSHNEDVKEFQQHCRESGIPPAWLDVKKWKVEPVTPLGMGNPTVALAMAKQLLEIMPIFDPTAQQEIKHEVVCIVTQDPRKAARWAPLGGNRGVTDAQRDSQSVFATLMLGVRLPPKEGLAASEQAETMLGMMAMKVNQCQQRDNMATADEAIGFQTVAGYIGQLVQQMAQDEQRKAVAKQISDALGKLMNEVKGLAQRWAEKQQKANGNGMDPAVMAKVQAIMLTAQAKIKAKEMADRQKAQQKERGFVHDQRRKDAETYHGMTRQDVEDDNQMASTRE